MATLLMVTTRMMPSDADSARTKVVQAKEPCNPIAAWQEDPGYSCSD